MIVSNPNLKDAILFEVDTSCMNKSMGSKRKISMPVFFGKSVNSVPDYVANENHYIMTQTQALIQRRKRFQRTASLPSFATGELLNFYFFVTREKVKY